MATVKLVDFDHVTDYISRQAAINIVCHDDCEDCPDGGCDMYRRMNRLPAADVRPAVRARWKSHGDCGVTECPVCRWSIEECIDYNFCPNCGADMREVKPNGES